VEQERVVSPNPERMNEGRRSSNQHTIAAQRLENAAQRLVNWSEFQRTTYTAKAMPTRRDVGPKAPANNDGRGTAATRYTNSSKKALQRDSGTRRDVRDTTTGIRQREVCARHRRWRHQLQGESSMNCGAHFDGETSVIRRW
jgi:hypothetical protein